MSPHRGALEAHWLSLIRVVLPSLSGPRGWPVRHDHCFARIILDQVCGGCWYDHIPSRPAYKHLSDAQLHAAVALAEAIVAGTADLAVMNRASLQWRAARRAQ
jgi:hypothetical protein